MYTTKSFGRTRKAKQRVTLRREVKPYKKRQRKRGKIDLAAGGDDDMEEDDQADHAEGEPAEDAEEDEGEDPRLARGDPMRDFANMMMPAGNPAMGNPGFAEDQAYFQHQGHGQSRAGGVPGPNVLSGDEKMHHAFSLPKASPKSSRNRVSR